MFRLVGLPVGALVLALILVWWGMRLGDQTDARQAELAAVQARTAGLERDVKIRSPLPYVELGPRTETARSLTRALLDAGELLNIAVQVEPSAVVWNPLRYGVWEGKLRFNVGSVNG